MDVFGMVASSIGLCDMILGYIQTAQTNQDNTTALQQQIPTTKQLLHALSPKVKTIQGEDQAALCTSIRVGRGGGVLMPAV